MADDDANTDALGLPSASLEAPSLSITIAALKTNGGAESESSIPSASPASPQAPEGFECAIQTLYEGPPKCNCCKNWVEECPDDLRMAVEEQPETKLKALVVRMRKNHDEGKPLVLDSFVVQSASLKKTLGEVFEGYKGITASLKKVVFKSPFHPFYYRWSRFAQIVERQKREDPAAAAYSQLLYNMLHKELRETMAEIDDHFQHNVITYELLWALFEPGMRIVATSDGCERFAIVSSCGYNHKGGYLGITAKIVDWDGQRFGYATTSMAICKYAGTQAVTELGVYPARFHPDREEAERKAIARGQRFRHLRGFHYMAYSGVVDCVAGKKTVKRNVCCMLLTG